MSENQETIDDIGAKIEGSLREIERIAFDAEADGDSFRNHHRVININLLANKSVNDLKELKTRLSSGNCAKMREALVALSAWAKVVKDNPKDKTAIECAEFVEETIKAALAEPARECDRFADDLQADGLHEAFVNYCNDCDCPMGCIHRMEMKGLLDVRCASILKCFARFALSEASPKEGGAK